MIKTIEIDDYTPTEGDRFLFDNDILILLFCPIGNHKQYFVEKYSKFLKRIQNSRSMIFVSALELSEFFNAYARIEFNIKKGQNPNKYISFKKDYRNSEEYSKTVENIKLIIKNQILKIAERLEDRFPEIDFDGLFNNTNNFDFNDRYYQALAAIENLIVVTNDADYISASYDIKVLTANGKLIAK